MQSETPHRVTLAIVGFGAWGSRHVATAFSLLDSQLKYVCDADSAKKESLTSISSGVRFTTSLEEVLDDPAVNAVIVATPSNTHHHIAKQCLEAGKNVLVEKPLSLHLSDGMELQLLAENRRRILMVGHLLLYHPAVRKLKELIDDGKLGKLQYIYSNRLNQGTVRNDTNILWSFAPHDISILQFLIGKDPLEIDANGGIFLQPGIHDVTLTMLRYPENIQAHIHVSWLHPFKEHRLVVIGDQGMAVFEDTKPQDKLVLFPRNGTDPHPASVSYENEDPLTAQLRHFIQCVTAGIEPLTSGRSALRVLEILEKAQRKLEMHNPKHYFVHESAVIDPHCEIGRGTKIWHFTHVQNDASVGENCTLGQNVYIGSHVRIGNFVKIQNNVSVYEGVELEDYVFCGPSVVFTNARFPRSEFPMKGVQPFQSFQSTVVRQGATIGANATIVCGNTIGQYAFVGAAAVVTHDVPDYALVVGNPARISGWICRCSYKLTFNGTQSTCAKCGRVYEQINNLTRCVGG